MHRQKQGKADDKRSIQGNKKKISGLITNFLQASFTTEDRQSSTNGADESVLLEIQIQTS